jgi:hypothetical protein
MSTARNSPPGERQRLSSSVGPLTALALLLPVGPLAAATPTPKVPADHAQRMALGQELFKQHVRGLLTARCLKCHGGEKTRSGLDLTTREGLLKGGDHGAVIVAGKGKDSRLFKLVARLAKPHMPPTGPALTRQQLSRLAVWIDLGAPYDKPLLVKAGRARKPMVVSDEDRKFWSFRPLKRPAPPTPKNNAWGRTPADSFILARLEDKGLTPTAPADRRTLIRRAYFDLIGLPPTPEEVEEFVHDKDPNAYEKVVDRLLASPHYGERWARHWLDLARFAESHGFEHDYDRPHAWPYRDFVIQALNADLPYNTFVAWQLAGDEIAPDDPLALAATGFLGAGVHSTQITANTVEKERYDELDDILRTTGTAMLGLTVGCARCHDHKYDPIPTRDYYRLLSTFTTTVRTEVDLDVDPAANRRARAAFHAELARRRDALARYERDELPARLDSWLRNRGKGEKLSAWTLPELVSAKSKGGATLTALPDGSLLASGKNPDFDAYTLVLRTHQRGITAFRLEALAHPSMVRGGPGRAGNGNFALSDLRVTAAPLKGGKPVAVKLVRAKATFEQKGLPVAAAIDSDPRSAWAVDPRLGKDQAAAFEPDRPIGFDGGTLLTFTLSFNNNTGHNIGRPRVSLTTVSPDDLPGAPLPEKVRDALARHDGKAALSPDGRAALLGWFRTTDGRWQKLHAAVEDLMRAGPKVATVKAMICSEGLPAVRLHTQGADFLDKTHFLTRGDPNQKDGEATQGFLRVLTRHPDGEKHWQVAPPRGWRTSYRRRSLADWVTDVDHGAGHLLARVMVNRLWQHHFGEGIVRTPSDFGFQGERPTHPELLDWLASELIRGGWRLKPIHRLLMTSAAYTQGSTFDPDKAKADPDNRLLWRRVPRRLEAEVIRDSLLAVSGRLDRRMFGPGTLDRKQPRRSIYFFVKRSQLVPMLVLFDAPDGLQGVEVRPTTTTAPQSLLLMNNELVRDCARSFARRLGPGKGAGLVRPAYELALGRAPSPRELAAGQRFLKEQAASYSEDGRPDPGGLALADFCQVLLGLNEFIYVD